MTNFCFLYLPGQSICIAITSLLVLHGEIILQENIQWSHLPLSLEWQQLSWLWLVIIVKLRPYR